MKSTAAICGPFALAFRAGRVEMDCADGRSAGGVLARRLAGRSCKLSRQKWRTVVSLTRRLWRSRRMEYDTRRN